MSFLFDTSILINLLRQSKAAWNFISSHEKDTLYTSSICEAEIHAGIYREKESNFAAKKKVFEELIKAFEVITFDSEQAEIAGRIKAGLAKKGRLIDDLDILIAAAALSENAILVTANHKHFLRIKDLEVHPLLQE